MLERAPPSTTGKPKGFDFINILYAPDAGPRSAVQAIGRITHRQVSLDVTTLLGLCDPAIARGEKCRRAAGAPRHRVVGTITGSEVTKQWGAEVLPEDTIKISSGFGGPELRGVHARTA